LEPRASRIDSNVDLAHNGRQIAWYAFGQVIEDTPEVMNWSVFEKRWIVDFAGWPISSAGRIEHDQRISACARAGFDESEEPWWFAR